MLFQAPNVYTGWVMQTLYYTRLADTLAGPLLIGATADSLVLLEFDRGVFPPLGPQFRDAGWQHSPGRTQVYVRQLGEYFRGKRRVFDFRIELRGTEFQKRCWNALLKIPFGETRTYAEIARTVDCPRGFRAVGMANHDNPIAIVVPCHRVLASDGTLGGYGGGLELKRRLLQLEGVILHEQRSLSFAVAG
jgi:methylated-DNA-[protein]-cysteine S-methyltransferase